MLARTLQHQDNRTDVSGYYIHCLAHGGRLGYDEVECFLVWYGIYISVVYIRICICNRDLE